MSTSGSSIVQHIIEHEILGINISELSGLSGLPVAINLTALDQPSGNLTLSGLSWNTSSSYITSVNVTTESENWDLYLCSNDLFDIAAPTTTQLVSYGFKDLLVDVNINHISSSNSLYLVYVADATASFYFNGEKRASPGSSSPPSELDGGIIADNTLWVFDEVNNKYMSSDRYTVHASRKGRAKNSYLETDGISHLSTGIRIPSDSVLTEIGVQTRENETWTLRLYRNNILLASLPVVEDDRVIVVLNVNLEQNDIIQLFADTTSVFGIRDVRAWFTYARRNDSLLGG